MSAGRFEFDTTAMRGVSNAVGNTTADYDVLIRNLYSLIEEFANSKDYSGQVTTEFYNKVMSQKSFFIRFSTTFNEYIENLNTRAQNIDNNTAYHTAKASRLGPSSWT